jgi:hypothetical protein
MAKKRTSKATTRTRTRKNASASSRQKGKGKRLTSAQKLTLHLNEALAIENAAIHKQIEKNKEIVLVNPFYETTNSVRQVLSQGNPGLDVS